MSYIELTAIRAKAKERKDRTCMEQICCWANEHRYGPLEAIETMSDRASSDPWLLELLEEAKRREALGREGEGAAAFKKS